MPIVHIEKDRQRRRENRRFGIGTWFDDAEVIAHIDDEAGIPDDNYVGRGKRVWMGEREVWHGDTLTHVHVYQYVRDDPLWLPVNPDYQEPEHWATCRACSRSRGCLSMPDTLGCMSQRYPESREELMAWYAKQEELLF